jgi:serine/threonine protein kinase
MYRPTTLQRGQLLNGGRYRIEREINRGGTAVVYEAEDTRSKQAVALKVMNGPDQVRPGRCPG